MPVGISGHTKVFALLGNPVTHSLSPALYNPQFALDGLDAVYVALETRLDAAGRLGEMIRDLGLSGVNLTVPFKQAIVPQLDALGPLAKALGTVNTVVNRGGHLTGYNTDAEGFTRGLELEHGPVIKGSRCVILGSGGAGLAIGAGLARAGASQVIWMNRTLTRAEAAVHTLATSFPRVGFGALPLTPEAFERSAEGATLFVQCLSGPGADAMSDFRPDVVGASAIWCDINYWMQTPPLLGDLEQRGLRVHRGHHMLAMQAVGAYEVFTGISPDPVRFLARVR